MIQVKIQNGNRMLDGNIFETEGGESSKPGIILIHGWQSKQDRMFEIAELLSVKLGFICLTLNLGGHGESDGKIGELSRKDFLEDAVAGYDLLANYKNVDKNKIGVIGSSFGGYLAALLSTKRELNFIAMRVPADYSDEDFDLPKIPYSGDKRLEFDSWRKVKRSWDQTSALKAVHNFKGKILIVESEKDDIVPHQVLQNYVDAVSDKNNLQFNLMLGATHSIWRDPELSKEFNEIVLKWTV